MVDLRLMHYLLNVHVTPLGIVNSDKAYKKPRPVFDSSFQPDPRSDANNNWVDLMHGPPLYFGPAFETFFIWLWNM